MLIESFGPRRTVGGCEINVECLEPVFVVDTIGENAIARIYFTNGRHVAQVVEIRCRKFMSERGDTRRRTYEVGGLTVASLPVSPKLLDTLSQLFLPDTRLLVFLEVVVEVEQRSFFFAGHVVFEEVGDVKKEGDVNAKHMIIEKHGEGCWVAIDCLLGTGEGKGGEVHVKFERPVEEEELEGLEERIDQAFAVPFQDISQEVGLLDIATDLYEIVGDRFPHGQIFDAGVGLYDCVNLK